MTMFVKRKKRNLWTYERCKEEVSKMSYLNELQGTSVVNALRRNGWFDELTSHLIRVVNRPYTKDDCIKEAKKYIPEVQATIVTKQEGVDEEKCEEISKNFFDIKYRPRRYNITG